MVLIFMADGFEEIEAFTVIDVLRRASINIKTISINSSKQVNSSKNISITTDLSMKDYQIKELDMIILPGGMPGTKNLDTSPFIDMVIQDSVKSGVWIAAICAAPMILGKRGLLKGESATCYPGFESNLVGATVIKEKVCISNNFITSRGAGTSFEFAYNLVGILKDYKTADNLRTGMLF